MQWLRQNALTITAILAGAGASFVASSVERRVWPIDSRVTVLEVQRAEDSERLRRIEDKLDRLIEQSRR